MVDFQLRLACFPLLRTRCATGWLIQILRHTLTTTRGYTRNKRTIETTRPGDPETNKARIMRQLYARCDASTPDSNQLSLFHPLFFAICFVCELIEFALARLPIAFVVTSRWINNEEFLFGRWLHCF